MNACCEKTNKYLSALQSLPLLFFRLVLAYGFWFPGLDKLNHVEPTAKWFASMGYPFPTLNVYLAGGTEVIGAVLLALGLGTRLISVPLMFVMIVAITTVHWSNGFQSSSNGFEIPLYYLLMLFSLFINGSGKISIDSLVCRK